MNTFRIKRPRHPLLINEWLTGALYGSNINKSRYVYCLHGDETIDSIARKLSGKQIKQDEPYCYEKGLDWKSLAQFNYGTTDPAEINWYLYNFNGCRRRDSSGDNYVFSRNDPYPFLWIPISNRIFAGKSGTPLKIIIDTSDIIRDVYYEDENGNKIDSVSGRKHIFLVVETRGATGKRVDIDLSDMKAVFKYNGNILTDSRLCDFEIVSDRMEIRLEIAEGAD